MLDELQETVSGKLFLDLPTRLLFARDSSFARVVPAGVFRPTDTEDLQKAIQFVSARTIPVAVRGGGTGKSGGCLTEGLLIDWGGSANRIQWVEGGSDLEVEAGASIAAVEEFLAPLGKTLGLPPEWRERSIGGVFATVSAEFKSGPWRSLFQVIQGGRFLLPEGQVIPFGDLAKSGEGAIDLEGWAQRIPLIRSASEEWLNKHCASSGFPGPRLIQGMNRQDFNPVGLLASGMGKTGVLLTARLRPILKPPGASSLLLAFADLPAALDFLGGLVCECSTAATLYERRQVRRALQHFEDPWLEWADKSGEWIALISLPQGDSASASLFRGIPNHQKLEMEECAFPDRVRFVMKSGLMRGGDALLRSNLGDFYAPAQELEKAIDKVREVLARSRVLAALMIHVDRGQIEVLPLGLGGEEGWGESRWTVIKSLGVRLAEAILELGGAIGLEYGLGPARKEWFERLPTGWRQYQTDLLSILDPGSGLKNETGDLESSHEVPAHEGAFANTEMQRFPLSGCTGCGGCRKTEKTSRLCPGFSAKGVEEATPRAKAMLAEAFARGELSDDDILDAKVSEIASWCVQCRMCEQGCPAGLGVPEWAQEISQGRFSSEGTTWPVWLLANADRLAPWLSLCSPVVNPLLRFWPVRWLLEKVAGLARERKIPNFTGRPFLDTAKRKGWSQVPVSPRMRAAVFVDYFANYHRPEIAESLVGILHHNRIEAHVPLDQISSGFAALVQGNRDGAVEQAKVNLRVYADLARDGFPIICTEPTAALFLRKDLPRLVPGEESRLVASQVVEATSFLFDLLGQGLLRTDFKRLDLSVDHHVPCHVKALGKGAAGPEILRRIPGMQVRMLDVSCSGMAGLWGMEKNNLASSFAIGQPMLALWKQKRASLGSSECSSCRMQMDHGDLRPVLHPLEIIAYAYGLSGKGINALMQSPGVTQ